MALKQCLKYLEAKKENMKLDEHYPLHSDLRIETWVNVKVDIIFQLCKERGFFM